jgi:hypothetical protein
MTLFATALIVALVAYTLGWINGRAHPQRRSRELVEFHDRANPGRRAGK